MESLGSLYGNSEFSEETLELILLTERICKEQIESINFEEIKKGCRLENGTVLAAELKDAYNVFREEGGRAVCSHEFGGQGLPKVVSSAVSEMWDSTNMSFALCPLLTAGAIDALEAHASPELKQLYLYKLVSGEWTGTMNLTEPQSGSDLSNVKTQAIPESKHYKIWTKNLHHLRRS